MGTNFQNTPLKQSRLLAKIINQYDHNNYQPKTIKFHLPYCKHNVDIICLDVRQAIYSLLSDEELMVQNNLIFCENLFEEPYNNPRDIKDINDGCNYQTAYYKWCKKEDDILCPIILFCD